MFELGISRLLSRLQALDIPVLFNGRGPKWGRKFLRHTATGFAVQTSRLILPPPRRSLRFFMGQGSQPSGRHRLQRTSKGGCLVLLVLMQYHATTDKK